MSNLSIILASQSPTRLELIKNICIIPDQIIPAHIDESEQKGELPGKVAFRLAYQKAIAVVDKIENSKNDILIIAADSVVAKGRRTLPKASTKEEVRYCLEMLSQRRHKVYTGICIIKRSNNEQQIRKKLVQTIVKFKKLSSKEIDFYCDIGEGIDKAGGYSILGYAESFVEFISGSFSNVRGLPLFETKNMLDSLGYKFNIQK